MIQLTNFASGELEISDGSGAKLRLNRDQANRLIMTARMHTVSEFVEKLPILITEPALLARIQQAFQEASASTDQWSVKEKFARLITITKGYSPADPTGIMEKITL